ncbi:MAG: hypothetical protein AVDCRST_MAG40-2317, partial [uncultured Gemmatimonadaceae bacterium]
WLNTPASLLCAPRRARRGGAFAGRTCRARSASRAGSVPR